MTPIGIAGSGRVAQAVGRVLAARGEPVVAVASRDSVHAATAAAFIGCDAMPLTELPNRAARILIAVSDDAVVRVAGQLARAGMKTGIALHTCGAQGPEILAPLAAAGVSCGVFHPLQTIATLEQGIAALPGSAFAISGAPDAVSWAEAICSLLGGIPLRVAPGRMPLYHAAAVLGSNYVTSLVDAAVMLMEAAGIDGKTALGALGPLVRASVENSLALGPEKALTGPIERGDVETVRWHLYNLGAVPRSISELYRSVGLHAVELARRRGLAESRARAIESLLREGR